MLIDAFQPRQAGLQGAMLVNGFDFRPYVVNDLLQMEAILSHFREFIERRGREAFKLTPMPQEATGPISAYGLSGHRGSSVRRCGFHGGQQRRRATRFNCSPQRTPTIIETKIWRGQVLYEEGLIQLADYLESEGQTTGYYVLFHARPAVYGKLPDEALEYIVQSPARQFMFIWCGWGISLQMDRPRANRRGRELTYGARVTFLG